MKLLILVILGITFIGLCIIIKDPAHKAGSPFTIVCTTSMLQNIIQNLVGPHARVIGLMGPGIDPHLYRARESDVRLLTHANLIVFNGLHLEGKMSDILEKMNSYIPVINASAHIPTKQLLDTEIEHMYDPHIWHDVSLWIQVVVSISNAIQELDPSHAIDYQKYTEQYIAQLQQLHRYVQQQIQRIPIEQRVLVTAHDAFRYFGKVYNIDVVGLQGTSTDAQISIKEVTDLATLISNKKIKALFAESCIPIRTILAVEHAVQAQGWSVAIGPELYADALGNNDEHAGTYIGMITHNVDAIVNALI